MKYRQLIRAIAAALQELAGRLASVANHVLVLRNWVVGVYLVEFERRGEDRAKYGEQLLKRISNDLEARELTGLSANWPDRWNGSWRRSLPTRARPWTALASCPISGRLSLTAVFRGAFRRRTVR